MKVQGIRKVGNLYRILITDGSYEASIDINKNENIEAIRHKAQKALNDAKAEREDINELWRMLDEL